MKYIRKNIANAPDWLANYRNKWDKSFGDEYPPFSRNPPSEIDQKEYDSLPKALAKEQYNICCYCMCRINEEGHDILPEHFVPQNRYIVTHKGRELGYDSESPFEERFHYREATNYNNLLASCYGDNCCSALKQNYPFIANPKDAICESIVVINENGDYIINDEKWGRDLIGTLDLSNRYKSQRQFVIDRARKRLKAKVTPDNVKFRSIVEQEIEYWMTPKNDRLEPFCMAAIHYLKSKLI
jgi:hypothetical protein